MYYSAVSGYFINLSIYLCVSYRILASYLYLLQILVCCLLMIIFLISTDTGYSSIFSPPGGPSQPCCMTGGCIERYLVYSLCLFFVLRYICVTLNWYLVAIRRWMTGRLSLLISLDFFIDCWINLSSLSRRFCIYYTMWSFGSSRVGTWYLYLVWRIYIVYVLCIFCIYLIRIDCIRFYCWVSYIFFGSRFNLNLLFSISGIYSSGVIWPVHSKFGRILLYISEVVLCWVLSYN